MPAYYKLVTENRKAWFDYNILETYTAGLVLLGSEVKSIRNGQVSLGDSFGRVERKEIWVYNLHISPYMKTDQGTKDPLRPKKVLLKKQELMKLACKATEKGLTIVPLKLFFAGNWAKLELALAKPKRKYEKREKIKLREVKKEIERAVRKKADE